MNIPLFIGILFALQWVCFVAGKASSSKIDTQTDYFLAGKEVSFFPLLMTFIATQIGGGLVLGSAEEAYHHGWSVLLYPLGACLGFVLLALGVGPKLARFNVATVAELFEVVYKSPWLKKLASSLSILSLFMILIAQVIASQKFMVSLGVDNLLFFLAFWAIVILYTTIGGLKAVVTIDIIQAFFFIVVFACGFLYIFGAKPHLLTTITQTHVNSEWNTSLLTGWLLMPLLFMVIEQDMAQRCFAANSPKVVTRASGWAAISVLAICIVPVSFGLLGKQLGLVVEEGSSVFMDVSKALTHPWIVSFIGCAVIMAIISTSISLINAVSSNLTQDFSLFSKSLTAARCATMIIGVLAVFGSFFFGSIVGMLIQSYELSVSCLFVPVLAALFKPQGRPLPAALAILGGAIGFIVFRIWEPAIPREILSLALSAAGFGIGMVAKPKGCNHGVSP